MSDKFFAENARSKNTERPFRCICGSLLARLVAEGVELKCRRCKRHVIIPLEDGDSAKMENPVDI